MVLISQFSNVEKNETQCYLSPTPRRSGAGSPPSGRGNYIDYNVLPPFLLPCSAEAATRRRREKGARGMRQRKCRVGT